VEDHAPLAENVSNALEDAGLHPTVQLSGASALSQRTLPRVALIDFMLPDIDGVDLTRVLVARDPLLRIQIITGYPEELMRRLDSVLDRIRLLDDGRPYVAKPFDLAELVRRVQTAANDTE
jgi:DNA-binding response OmpR family regulator